MSAKYVVGRTDASWKKHALIEKVAMGQAWNYRVTHPNDKVVIIDTNAGDGEGVPLAQGDFFHQQYSLSTPEFQPEWEWVEHLWNQARQSRIKIYWKENLTVRPKELPWS